MIADSRPTYPYRLPDGTVVRITHDHGEVPAPVSTFQLMGGEVVEMVLEDEKTCTCGNEACVRRVQRGMVPFCQLRTPTAAVAPSACAACKSRRWSHGVIRCRHVDLTEVRS